MAIAAARAQMKLVPVVSDPDRVQWDTTYFNYGLQGTHIPMHTILSSVRCGTAILALRGAPSCRVLRLCNVQYCYERCSEHCG